MLVGGARPVVQHLQRWGAALPTGGSLSVAEHPEFQAHLLCAAWGGHVHCPPSADKGQPSLSLPLFLFPLSPLFLSPAFSSLLPLSFLPCFLRLYFTLSLFLLLPHSLSLSPSLHLTWFSQELLPKAQNQETARGDWVAASFHSRSSWGGIAGANSVFRDPRHKHFTRAGK